MPHWMIYGLGCLSGATGIVFVIGLVKCFAEDRLFRRDYSPDLIRKLEDR